MKHTRALAACWLLALACQPAEDRPAPPNSEADLDLTDLIQYEPTSADTRDVFATGACSEGSTRACRIYLPSHNDVQPCFVGVQACVGSRWGDCESGVLVDANDQDTELDPDALPE